MSRPRATPVLAVVIRADAVFTHCAKAFRRSRLWQPASWPTENAHLSLGAHHRRVHSALSFSEYKLSCGRVIEDDLVASRPEGGAQR